MSKKNWDAKASNYDDSSWESESDEAIDDRVYAEEGEYGNLGRKFGPEFPGECQVKKWGDLGEFGEAKRYYIFEGEGTEYGDTFGEYESGAPSMPTVAATEIEETEEEKALRKEREQLIDDVKVKIMERMLLRRRNAFLQKKLVEHFRKRRMEDVFKQETKGQ